jgi:hypothetical protein
MANRSDSLIGMRYSAAPRLKLRSARFVFAMTTAQGLTLG